MKVFEELKRLIQEAHVDYKAFMGAIGCYDVDEADFESLYPYKSNVDARVVKAQVEGRLLVDENDQILHYWLTHSDCRIMALFIRLLLGTRFNLKTCTMNSGRLPYFHAVVRVEVDGVDYYVDGLQYSKHPEDLNYDMSNEYVDTAVVLEKEEKDFTKDEATYALLMLWCRNFNIDLYRSFSDDWVRPKIILTDDDIKRRMELVSVITKLERVVL